MGRTIYMFLQKLVFYPFQNKYTFKFECKVSGTKKTKNYKRMNNLSACGSYRGISDGKMECHYCHQFIGRISHHSHGIAPHEKEKRGRIINIASARALAASAFKSAYVATKHGILGLTKVVALETAQEGITCNAICPGYVKTPLVDWLKEEHKNKLKHILIHSIRADKELCDLSVASKINTDWHFLLYLRDLGRKAADQWLQENFNSLGKRSTVDLHAEFLDLGVEHMG